MIENIRIVKYNNKSRKGTYLGIKETGKRERLLKYQSGSTIDTYVEGIETGKNWRAIQQQAKAEIMAKKDQKKIRGSLKGRVTISQKMTKGVTKAETDLSRMGNTATMAAIYKKIFSPLVKDKRLLKIITQNINKLNRYFSYKIKVDGQKGRLVTVNDIGKRTPQEIYTQYHGRNKWRKGLFLTNEKVDRDTTRLSISKGAVLKSRGEKDYQAMKEGKITRIKVEILYQYL